ncbi:peptide deformylase [Deferribacter autotrophicus]|uniref:Peptide deformylase n=1 Tax=Deferribacter autotrophicus TaxID=500465 RepID=A0A5A8F702_9BACT|nr:peptide deformylase [Deferribacter autotrophicus]KAA0259069.1 peptide deformylase [Deferribacter autotrophicus]
MAVREVLVYPNPLLKEISKEVNDIDEKIKNVIEDLIDTMDATSHSTGIAAPQIGELVRIIAIDPGKNKKCKNHHGKRVMINPEIIKWEGLIQSREGCMSVPDFTGNVNRAEKIVVQFFDENMKQHVFETEGFEAILIQHEIDHLDGILFIDRIISKRTDLFRRKKYK